MKILLHVPWGIKKDFIGGTERFVINLAKGLNEKGHEAFVVCSNLEEEIFIEGVTVKGFIPEKFRKSVERYGYVNENFIKNEILGGHVSSDSLKIFSEYVGEQVGKYDYDVLHLNGFFYSLYLNENIAIPALTVITNHETKNELINYWGHDVYEVFKDALSKSNFLLNVKSLIVPSKYYANEYSNLLGKRVISIPIGITHKQLEYSPIRKEMIATRTKQKKQLIILMPSRFDMHQKGHDIALKGLSILKHKGVNFSAIFSGFDKETYSKNYEQFFSLAMKGNLLENIVLKKFRKMTTAYEKADIVISPERFCSYGLAISESLSIGIPTILSPIPTYKEIASGYAHAYFMKKNTPNDLAMEILNILKKGLGKNLIEADRFNQEYKFEKCVNKHIDLYESSLL